MASRSHHSTAWLIVAAGGAAIIAVVLWLLFAGSAATPTVDTRVDLDLPRPALPDTPDLRPVDPPTVAAQPTPSPAA